MAIHSRKKPATRFTNTEGKKKCGISGQNGEVEAVADTSAVSFPILELPTQLVYDILSRLPLKTIFLCRCVCKKFLQLLKDHYFAQVHLAKAPTTTASLILLQSLEDWGILYFYMFDLDESSITSSCSSAPYHGPQLPRHSLTELNAEFCFSNYKVDLVGSCDGLLCLYSASEMPFYCICNPILGEYVILPPVTPSTSDDTYYDHSAFGFSPKTKQYKVIRFMSLMSVDPITALPRTKSVAEIHTLGSYTWRRIEDAPSLKLHGSFDPCLNGVLHWIIDGKKTSDLICSFDLETERFMPLPPPCHFSLHYISKISWINIGILEGCLCLCYVYEDTQFEIWLMKDYGVKESWMNVCRINMKFYCGLQVEDLRRPIKFLSNGDLWLICSSNSLLSYSPKKGTFREYKKLEHWNAKVISHIPSFISLKHAAEGKDLEVKNLEVYRPMLILNV